MTDGPRGDTTDVSGSNELQECLKKAREKRDEKIAKTNAKYDERVDKCIEKHGNKEEDGPAGDTTDVSGE